ncbi:hypothetical protein K438DRAFT_1959441 [Mycena galopus ATCC 62051]|nr:hypothetical protein K438DRAFT_1959441 [Mycena galopus ATCC 62051]
MSGDLRAWIREHITGVAETYGGNLSVVPLHAKAKKVQISEFLTVGAENEREDAAVWATVHDKVMSVPVKFSKEAVMECNKNSVSGRRLTETKTALVAIKKFRPISTRIPFRSGGMTAESHVALHCESVSILGSIGESKWGNPKDLDSDPDLREWSQALRQDGGAGNVLKERKKMKEGNNKKTTPPMPAKRVVSPRKPSPVVKSRAQASTSKISQPTHMLREWEKRWHNPPAPRPPTPPRAPPADARDLNFSSPSEKYSVTSSPISGWSPTVAGSSPWKNRNNADSRSPTPEESNGPRRSAPSSPCPVKESSYLTAPTPAQRRRSASPVVRKVARPPPPPPPASGPARILVPNSDTSQSQPSQPSQPSQRAVPVAPLVASSLELPPQPSPAPLSQSVISQNSESELSRVSHSAPMTIPEDLEILSEDDAETHRRRFQHRSSPLDQRGPEDVGMLSEDDAETHRRLFRRRGSPLDRVGPAKKRRMMKENDNPVGSRSSQRKLDGFIFSVGLDSIELGDFNMVGWEQLWGVLNRL